MQGSKTGILLVNLGTPDAPTYRHVRRYLSEFLMDGRVIDLPYWKRFLLVRGIIAPFRSAKVAREYRKLWLPEGSPLLVHGQSLAHQLQARFSKAFPGNQVALAMRYQNPGIRQALEQLRNGGAERIVVFPLFPQYASATTGSVAQKVMEIVSEWEVIPALDFIQSYQDHPQFIEAFASKIQADIDRHQPDHILFSYHGIPERHLDNIKQENPRNCAWPKCNCETKSSRKPFCYRSASFETSERLATRLGLRFTKYSTAFQSRLGKSPWIQPYTDETIRQLAQRGIKKLLVVSPSFVADCLETTLEIGEEYRELFLERGGTSFHFTESLNASEAWVDAIYEMINEKIGRNETIPNAKHAAWAKPSRVRATA